jgi:hypothetical protein
MQDSDIPTLIGVAFGQFAGAGYIRPVPVASQIGIQNGAASFHDGFVPDNFTPENVGGVPPFGQDMNGVLNQITQWVKWYNGGGPNYYNSAFSSAIGGYAKYAILNQAGVTGAWWISTVDNNTSNPDTGGANWVAFPNNIVAARTVTAGGAFTINASDAYIALKRTTSIGVSSATLPSSVNGKQFTVADVLGDLNAHPCTITPNSGAKIAEMNNYVMNIDRQSATFTFFADSNEWSAT